MAERLQNVMERGFGPGHCFANELDLQLPLDARFDSRPNPCVHKMPCPPIDRLIVECTAPDGPAAPLVRTSSERPVGECPALTSP